MSCRTCDKEGYLCANQVDLESCEGRELLADDTVSELDLKRAGLVFLFERVQDTWE